MAGIHIQKLTRGCHRSRFVPRPASPPSTPPRFSPPLSTLPAWREKALSRQRGLLSPAFRLLTHLQVEEGRSGELTLGCLCPFPAPSSSSVGRGASARVSGAEAGGGPPAAKPEGGGRRRLRTGCEPSAPPNSGGDTALPWQNSAKCY